MSRLIDRRTGVEVSEEYRQQRLERREAEPDDFETIEDPPPAPLVLFPSALPGADRFKLHDGPAELGGDPYLPPPSPAPSPTGPPKPPPKRR